MRELWKLHCCILLRVRLFYSICRQLSSHIHVYLKLVALTVLRRRQMYLTGVVWSSHCYLLRLDKTTVLILESLLLGVECPIEIRLLDLHSYQLFAFRILICGRWSDLIRDGKLRDRLSIHICQIEKVARRCILRILVIQLFYSRPPRSIKHLFRFVNFYQLGVSQR